MLLGLVDVADMQSDIDLAGGGAAAGMQPEDGGGVMETYMECLYSLAHAFKVFCYYRQSWTWTSTASGSASSTRHRSIFLRQEVAS